MVAGRNPPGHPVCIEPMSPDAEKVDGMTRATFGHDLKLHEISRMPIEQGSGALHPDDQARYMHVPHIRATQGDAAANVMLAKLNKSKPTLIGE